MKNRYDGILRKYNHQILEAVPYNPFLFVVGAKEIMRLHKKGYRVLEIGSGEGDSTLPLLARSKIKIDMLDVSKEMIDISKKRLQAYAPRINFICRDAYEYLSGTKSYHIIFSGWTLHNFRQEDKRTLVEAIYKNLPKKGTFILLDKVYPKNGREIAKNQYARYRRYLPAHAASAIISHERIDETKAYRMTDSSVINLLKAAGFKTVKFIDRVEKDAVVVAQK